MTASEWRSLTVEGGTSSRSTSGAMKRSVPLTKTALPSVPTLSLSTMATSAVSGSTSRLPRLMSR